jgi:hypothetical protein
MIRAYQLMIMRLMLLEQHQSHDHELERAAVRGKPGLAGLRGKPGLAVVRGKAGQ